MPRQVWRAPTAEPSRGRPRATAVADAVGLVATAGAACVAGYAVLAGVACGVDLAGGETDGRR
jgi:hypothetical protein